MPSRGDVKHLRHPARWYVTLSPALQVLFGVAVITAIGMALVVVGFVGLMEWQDRQFRSSEYCQAEPHDPLC